ncbi:MAG: rhodanese [Alphaproteobacteria bacterium HGW-Alphaproteobacteria-6]|nr:MAG: rhodanese [Alphaproteobacteria bacterium HGW-Alphaproteobacteria-6]
MTPGRGSAALFAALVAACLAPGPAPAEVAEPDGYRTADYRAEVPATLAGARVLDPAAAHERWLSGAAAFVDVLPNPPRPANLPAGTVWRDKPRHSIPGAIWLANAGYGALAPAMEDYFRAGLARVSGGNPDHPLVFFCLAECWMSWNAARRAVGYGYSQVNWFPAGTDGWAEGGWPTELLTPEPGGQ